MTRTKNSLNNLIVSSIGQVLVMIISFFARMVFINILGNEVLGLNGLFTNVLTVLSLVELGIGPAIVYSLYKPIAEDDQKKVSSIMALYKKLYIIIGIVIAVLGLLFTPFVGYLIKDQPDIDNISLIFILFVLNTSISYFFSYKRTFIIANQKKYVTDIYRYSCLFILTVIQIIILLLTKNYILFLLLQIFFTFLENFLISLRANKMYPFLKEKDVEEVSKETKKEIYKNSSALVFHKIGDILVLSIDNIIISTVIGLVWVGYYSNYLLIISAINVFFALLFNSISASIGNLIATESTKKVEETFNHIFFINFWLASVVSICLLILINPFISLWIGSDNLLSSTFVIVLVVNFYFNNLRKTVNTFKTAYGLFWQDRFKPLIESVVNLIFSVILAKKFGIVGVLLGTIISNVLVAFWIEGVVLYKNGLKVSSINYFKKVIYYTLLSVVVYFITINLIEYIQVDGFLGLLIKGLMSFSIINIIYLLIFFKNKSFKYIVNRIMDFKNNLFYR